MTRPVLFVASVVTVLACGGLPNPAEDPPAPAPEQVVVDEPTAVLPEPAAEATPAPTPPAAPRAVPALAHPVDDNGRCTIRNLATGDAIATFLKPCARWSISAHPNRPTDVLVAIEGSPPRHGTKALPRLPEPDDVDAVGFDTKGRIVAFTAVLVDPVVGDTPNRGTVTIDGTALEVEVDEMFGMVACRTYQLDGATWRKIGTPGVVQLHEGMSSPYCTRADGVPALAPLHQPGLDETMPAEFGELSDPPEALTKLSNDDFTSWATIGDDLAVKYMYFEGARLQAPFATNATGSWTVLEGLTDDEPASMFTSDGFLLVCSGTNAHVYDTRAGYARVWSAEGQCPVFWPLEG